MKFKENQATTHGWLKKHHQNLRLKFTSELYIGLNMDLQK